MYTQSFFCQMFNIVFLMTASVIIQKHSASNQIIHCATQAEKFNHGLIQVKAQKCSTLITNVSPK